MSNPPLEGSVAVRRNLVISAALVAVFALVLALALGVNRPEPAGTLIVLMARVAPARRPRP